MNNHLSPTSVFAEHMQGWEISNILMMALPYIANRLRWKSFVVFMDRLVTGNFSSELAIMPLCNTQFFNHETFSPRTILHSIAKML